MIGLKFDRRGASHVNARRIPTGLRLTTSSRVCGRGAWFAEGSAGQDRRTPRNRTGHTQTGDGTCYPRSENGRDVLRDGFTPKREPSTGFLHDIQTETLVVDSLLDRSRRRYGL